MQLDLAVEHAESCMYRVEHRIEFSFELLKLGSGNFALWMHNAAYVRVKESVGLRPSAHSKESMDPWQRSST